MYHFDTFQTTNSMILVYTKTINFDKSTMYIFDYKYPIQRFSAGFFHIQLCTKVRQRTVKQNMKFGNESRFDDYRHILFV